MDDQLRTAEQTLRTIPEYRWLVNSEQPFWSSGNVAEHLAVSPTTVRLWCESGGIVGAAFYGGRIGWRMPRSGLIIFLAGLIGQRR